MNISTGNLANNAVTASADWEGAVIKKNGVEVGRVKGVRGAQVAPTKKQVTHCRSK